MRLWRIIRGLFSSNMSPLRGSEFFAIIFANTVHRSAVFNCSCKILEHGIRMKFLNITVRCTFYSHCYIHWLIPNVWIFPPWRIVYTLWRIIRGLFSSNMSPLQGFEFFAIIFANTVHRSAVFLSHFFEILRHRAIDRLIMTDIEFLISNSNVWCLVPEAFNP